MRYMVRNIQFRGDIRYRAAASYQQCAWRFLFERLAAGLFVQREAKRRGNP